METTVPQRQLTFGDILKLHQEAQRQNPASFADMSLNEFANAANRATGTTVFNPAIRGPLGEAVARVSSGVDRLFEPVAEPLGRAGAWGFSKLFGPKYEELGRESGEAIPRTMVELGVAPLAIAREASLASRALGLMGAAASGASAYTSTGSPSAGVIAGTAAPFFGPAMERSAKFMRGALYPLAPRLGTPAAAVVNQLGESFGANVAAMTMGEMQRQATSQAISGEFAPIFTREHGVEMIGGQLPFIGLDIARSLRARPNDYIKKIATDLIEEVEAEKARIAQTTKKDSGVPRETMVEEPIPDVTPKVPTFADHLDDTKIKNTALTSKGGTVEVESPTPTAESYKQYLPALVAKYDNPSEALTKGLPPEVRKNTNHLDFNSEFRKLKKGGEVDAKNETEKGRTEGVLKTPAGEMVGGKFIAKQEELPLDQPATKTKIPSLGELPAEFHPDIEAFWSQLKSGEFEGAGAAIDVVGLKLDKLEDINQRQRIEAYVRAMENALARAEETSKANVDVQASRIPPKSSLEFYEQSFANAIEAGNLRQAKRVRDDFLKEFDLSPDDSPVRLLSTKPGETRVQTLTERYLQKQKVPPYTEEPAQRGKLNIPRETQRSEPPADNPSFEISRSAAHGAKERRQTIKDPKSGATLDYVDVGDSLYVLAMSHPKHDVEISDPVLLSRLTRRAKQEGKPVYIQPSSDIMLGMVRQMGFVPEGSGYRWDPKGEVPKAKVAITPEEQKGETQRQAFLQSRGSMADQFRAQLKVALGSDAFPVAMDAETRAKEIVRISELLETNALHGIPPGIQKRVTNRAAANEELVKLMKSGLGLEEALYQVHNSMLERLRVEVEKSYEFQNQNEPPPLGKIEQQIVDAVGRLDQLPPHLSYALQHALDGTFISSRSNNPWSDWVLDQMYIWIDELNFNKAVKTKARTEYLKREPDAEAYALQEAEWLKSGQYMEDIAENPTLTDYQKAQKLNEKGLYARMMDGGSIEQTARNVLEYRVARHQLGYKFMYAYETARTKALKKQQTLPDEVVEIGKFITDKEEEGGEHVVQTLHDLSELDVSQLDEKGMFEAETRASTQVLRDKIGRPSEGAVADAMNAAGFQRIRSSSVEKLHTLLDEFYKGNLGITTRLRNGVYTPAYVYKFGNKALAEKLGVVPDNATLWLKQYFTPVLQKLIVQADKMYEVVGPNKGPYLPQKAETVVNESAIQEHQPFPPEVLEDFVANGLSPAWLTSSKSDTTTASQVHTLYRAQLMYMGHEPAVAESLAMVATKVAATFKDVGRVRVAELVGKAADEFFGLSIHENTPLGEKGMIALGGPLQVYKRLFEYKANVTAEEATNIAVLSASQTVAHEMLHTALRTEAPLEIEAAYRKLVQRAEELDPKVRGLVIRKLYQETIGRGLRPDSYTTFDEMLEYRRQVAEENPEEFLADFVAMTVSGKAAKAMSGEMKALPAEFGHSMNRMFRDVRDILNSMKESWDVVMSNDPVGRSLYSVLTSMVDAVDVVTRDTAEINRVATEIQKLNAMSPVSIMDAYAEGRAIPKFSEMPSLFRNASVNASLIGWTRKVIGLDERTTFFEKKAGLSPRWWMRWFPSTQAAEAVPMIKPIIDLGRSFRGLTEDMMEKTLAPFLTKVDRFGRKVLDAEGTGVKYVLGDVKANQAHTLIALMQQEEKIDLATAQKKFPKFFDDTLKGFTADQKAKILNFRAAEEEATEISARFQLDLARESVRKYAAGVIARSHVVGVKDALAMGGDLVTLHEELKNADPADPGYAALLAKNTAARHALIAKLGNETYANAVDEISKVYPKLDKLAAIIKDKKWYMSEVRLGKYFVYWKDPMAKRPGVAAFDTEAQANAVLEQKDALGFATRAWRRSEEHHPSLNKELLEAGAELERATYGSLLAGLPVTPETEAMAKNYVPMESFFKEYQGKGIGKYMLERKLAPGREYLNMAQGFFDHIQAMSYGLARQNIKEELALWQHDQQLHENPEMRDWATGFVNGVLDPSGREWVAFKKLNFVMFMGMNISNQLIEASQPLLTLMPFLTKESGSFGVGYKYLGKAASELAYAYSNRVPGKPFKYRDADLGGAIEKAYSARVLDFGVTNDFNSESESAITNLRRFASDTGPFEKVKGGFLSATSAYYNFVRNIYAIAPKANSHISFITSFLAARDGEITGKRMSVNEAYEFATRAVAVTNFGGGTAARPMFFQNLGKMLGPLGAWYSLGSYVFSTMAMYTRWTLDSLHRSGLSPTDVKRSRMALAQMMGTQAALAGAMGLPMAAGAIAVIEQLIPEAKVRENIHMWLANLGETMFHDGGRLAAIAERGIVNGMFNVDLSSRIGLSNMMGVSPADGFSLANLTGPSGAIVENVMRGIQDTSRGDVLKGTIRMLPVAYQNIAKLMVNDGTVKDQLGRTVFNPTPTQKAMMVMGFKPEELRAYYESQQMIERAERVDEAQMRRFHEGLADKLLAGDVATVRNTLRERALNDPAYDVRTGAKRIAELAQERTLTFDPSRSVNRHVANEAARIKSMFPSQTQERPSEMQRLMERKQLERALGIMGVGNVSAAELRAAQMTDQLMASDPRMSRVQAVMQMDRLMRRQPTF